MEQTTSPTNVWYTPGVIGNVIKRTGDNGSGLEPDEGKPSRPVLRGLEGGNTLRLPGGYLTARFVQKSKLLRWQDFRRKALEPAVQQINDNSAKARFQVRLKLVKEGRAIKWVKFEVIKTTERLVLDAKLQDREKQLNLFDIRLKTTTYEKAKTLASG